MPRSQGIGCSSSSLSATRLGLASIWTYHLTVVAKVPEDSATPALVISSKLLGFKGMPITLQLPGPGITQCELLSELKDGQTGRRIGQIVASDLEEGIRPMTVLNECAHDVGDAIARQLRR